MDWPHFLDQAIGQQVACLIGRNLTYHVPPGLGLVPNEWIYSAAYEANVRRNRSLFAEFARILRALDRSGVGYAVRKGPALCSLVYDDMGIRRMSDLDVLIERESEGVVAELLADLGYAQGVRSPDGDRVVPHRRQTRLFWAMHLNNALPYLKRASEPEVRWFEVDLCLDLFQQRSAGSVETGSVLRRARRWSVCGEASRVLGPLDQLLDLCLHLYKEATSYLSIAQGRDLAVMRFIDVLESLRVTAAADLELLPQFARDVGAEREVYFALHHACLLFPHAVPPELLDGLDPGDRAYLDEYGALEDRTTSWQRGFLDRIFDPQRRAELAGPSSIPTS